jgi:integrase
VARSPRGKRTPTGDGSHGVVAKNPNGTGSVYYEPPRVRADGRKPAGRWRATWVDHDGRIRKVSAPTRAEAEAKRNALAATANGRRRPSSRFGPTSTVNDLLAWWLDSVARHRVKTSTFDSYRRFASYLADGIGTWRIVDVGPEALTDWQAELLDRFAPYTVLNCRKVCRQAFREAVKLDLIATNPFDLVDAPRATRVGVARALDPASAKALLVAAQELRLGAAVTLLFVQGWRVSEVLGLAWEDLDLDAATAQVRRGAAYTPSIGTVLGATKTSGAEGVHHLAPISVDRLRRRRTEQAAERARTPEPWPVHASAGEPVSPVFTTLDGRLVNRQSVVKAIHRAAVAAGLNPTGLATHTGRRTVITALYADGGLDLTDVARHVGHADTATTAGYVRSLGHRPATTARRAAELLDPTLDAEEGETG